MHAAHALSRPDIILHQHCQTLSRARAAALFLPHFSLCAPPQEEPEGASSGLQVVVLNLPWATTCQTLKAR
jgi:hypothetical protein